MQSYFTVSILLGCLVIFAGCFNESTTSNDNVKSIVDEHQVVLVSTTARNEGGLYKNSTGEIETVSTNFNKHKHIIVSSQQANNRAQKIPKSGKVLFIDGFNYVAGRNDANVVNLFTRCAVVIVLLLLIRIGIPNAAAETLGVSFLISTSTNRFIALCSAIINS